MTTKLEAQGRWFNILSHYIPPEFLDGKHHGCPICGNGKDKFRFDDKDGSGSFFCNSCGAGSGIHLLSQYMDCTHSDAYQLVEKVIGSSEVAKQPEHVDMKKRIAEILQTCNPADANVKKYMASRGLETPDSLLAGKFYFERELTDCMIAKVSCGKKLVGLHATYIKDGKKVGRRMYATEKGSMVGGAVRLHRLNGGDAIVIGEGMETSLSASLITGLPAWAALSAGMLEAVQIPDCVRRIVIAADNDLNFTGLKSAYTLAHRLAMKGKSVEVITPGKGDFNDQDKVAN